MAASLGANIRSVLRIRLGFHKTMKQKEKASNYGTSNFDGNDDDGGGGVALTELTRR